MSGLNKVHIQRTYWITTKEFFRYGVMFDLWIHIYKSNRNAYDTFSQHKFHKIKKHKYNIVKHIVRIVVFKTSIWEMKK